MATMINWGAFYAGGGYYGDHDPAFYAEDINEDIDEWNEHLKEEEDEE